MRTCFYARRCPLGIAIRLLPIYGHNPPNLHFCGVNRYFKAKLAKYQQLHIIETTTSIDRWRDSATGRALDLRSVGRGFKSYSRQRCVTINNLRQVVHTYVPL